MLLPLEDEEDLEEEKFEEEIEYFSIRLIEFKNHRTIDCSIRFDRRHYCLRLSTTTRTVSGKCMIVLLDLLEARLVVVVAR